MSPTKSLLLLLLAGVATAQHHTDDGDMLSEVGDCLLGGGTTPAMTCLRLKVLGRLDGAGEARSTADDAELDELIVRRARRYLDTHEFRLQLPEFLFQGAELTFRPSRGLADFAVSFPPQDPSEDRSIAAARGMLKKKLLLPVLLLLKLKMKALTPLLLAIVGLKALKALVLSKVAILLVVGFLASQLFKKLGMPMPMPMNMPMPMPMPEQYGVPAVTPPAPAMPYGLPAPGSVSTQPSSSYEVSWDSGSSGGPYSRVWDAQQAAYGAYSPQQTSSQSRRRR